MYIEWEQNPGDNPNAYGTNLIATVKEVPFFNEFHITQTIATTLIVDAVIIVIAILLASNLKKIPKGKQVISESIIGMVDGLVTSAMGKKQLYYAPYVLSILLFIGCSNIVGLFGLRPPTADVNTTFALAIITFILIQFSAIYNQGFIGYLKSFLDPFFLFLPMNIIGMFATPISLGFRLFGNITGGMIIVSLLYDAVGKLAFIPFISVLHIYFDLFSGILQSFIFCMLTMSFVGSNYPEEK